MIFSEMMLKENVKNSLIPGSVIFHVFSRHLRKTAAVNVARLLLEDDTKKMKDIFDCVMYIEKNESGNLTVDAVQVGAEYLQKTPYGRKANVLIIDDAEYMTEEAANSLLKLLEEPPENSYCFLLTSDYETLLPTIRSRCAYYRLAESNAEDYYMEVRSNCKDINENELRFFNKCRGISPDEESLKAIREADLSLMELIEHRPDAPEIMRYAESVFSATGRSGGNPAITFEVFLCLLATYSFDAILFSQGLTDRLIWKNHESLYKKLDFNGRFSIIVEETAEIFLLKRINVNKKLAAVSVLIDFSVRRIFNDRSSRNSICKSG